MTRTRRTLTSLACLALGLGVPAVLVLGTGTPASACGSIVSHGAAPLCGGPTGSTYSLTATPVTTGPDDPITLQMALTGIGIDTDLNPNTRFSIDGGTCTGNVCSSDVPGTHTVTAVYSSATGGTVTLTKPVAVLAVDHLAVSPLYTTATAGQTIAYTISRATAGGVLIDDISSRATVTLDGAPCPGAVCTATTAGEQILTATYDGMTAGGAVMVSPGPAASLVVTPHVDVYWNDVHPASFTVEAYDVGGNDLGDVTGQSSFAIQPTGGCSLNVCTSGSLGSHTVTATYGALTGSVTVDATDPMPAVAPSLPAGQVGVPYAQSVLSATDPSTGGATSTDLDSSSTLPPGLTLGQDGVLSGTPTAAGSYAFYVVAWNSSFVVNSLTTITIAPGAVPTTKPTVSIGSSSVVEGNSGRTPVTLTVHLSHAYSRPVTVSWHTGNGTAVAGKDYVAAHGTVTIPAGQLTATIQVPVIGDRIKEPNERFAVVLTNPHGATLGTARGTVTVTSGT